MCITIEACRLTDGHAESIQYLLEKKKHANYCCNYDSTLHAEKMNKLSSFPLINIYITGKMETTFCGLKSLTTGYESTVHDLLRVCSVTKINKFTRIGRKTVTV